MPWGEEDTPHNVLHRLTGIRGLNPTHLWAKDSCSLHGFCRYFGHSNIGKLAKTLALYAIWEACIQLPFLAPFSSLSLWFYLEHTQKSALFPGLAHIPFLPFPTNFFFFVILNWKHYYLIPNPKYGPQKLIDAYYLFYYCLKFLLLWIRFLWVKYPCFPCNCTTAF